MSRKTIQFGEGQSDYIEMAVKQRGYRSDSEYIRDLVRRDEEKNREFLELRAELQKGFDSGISNRSINEVLEEGGKRFLEIKAAIDEGYNSGISPKKRSVKEIMETANKRQGQNKKAKMNG